MKVNESLFFTDWHQKRKSFMSCRLKMIWKMVTIQDHTLK